MPIEWSDIEPSQWRREALPDVDLVRPPACPACLAASKSGGRVILHGHGPRQREVVVPAALGEEHLELLECWVRRYRCVQCGAVVTVLPKGVLPRYLYSVAAMVMAFLLVVGRPVGEGLSDADAYDRQGMNRRRGWTTPWPYRWRSPDRWFGMAGTWWPGRAVAGLRELLLGFVVDAGRGEVREVLVSAVGRHVRWGCAM